MTKYTVLGTYDVRFTVEAETADEAAEMVEQGEAGNGEIEGASVDKVTSKYKYGAFWSEYEDERSYCTCGHLMDQHHGPGSCHYYSCKCVTPILAAYLGGGPDA